MFNMWVLENLYGGKGKLDNYTLHAYLKSYRSIFYFFLKYHSPTTSNYTLCAKEQILHFKALGLANLYTVLLKIICAAKKLFTWSCNYENKHILLATKRFYIHVRRFPVLDYFRILNLTFQYIAYCYVWYWCKTFTR